MSKRCPRCKKAKSEDQFYKNRSKKDGLRTYCIECEKPLIKEYQKNNREKIKKYKKKYRKENKDKINNYKIEWVEKKKLANSQINK